MKNLFQDIRVIELASVLAGPSVGMFLAELGAEVIKVENIAAQGDVTRSWKLTSEPKDTDISAYFSSVNWGKKSIGINLKEKAGQQLIHSLVKQADIVISSFFPGKDEALNMNAEKLMSINPQLICAEINGYGPTVQRAAFDAIIQAESGFSYLNGLKGQGNIKMPVALMDVLAGHQLKEAILLAFIHRLQTGEGQRVSVSLIESAISSLVNQATNWIVAKHSPEPLGSDHPNIVPYGTSFSTKEGKSIVLAVGNDRQFAALCQVLHINMKEEWRTNLGRLAKKEELLQVLSDKVRRWNRAEILQKLAEKKVPAGAINKLPEVFEMNQAQRLLIKRNEIQGVKSYAAKHHGQEEKENSYLLSTPPHFNEHALYVLAQLLRLEEDEIMDLSKRGVILFD